MNSGLRILFLDDDNTRRSVMAEVLLRAKAGDDISVESAGVTVGDPCDYTDAALREIGLSSADHEPRSLPEIEETTFDIVVTLGEKAKEFCERAERAQASGGSREDCQRVGIWYPSSSVHLHWETENPLVGAETDEDTANRFRKAREELQQRLAVLLETGHFEAVRRQKQYLQTLLDSLEIGIMAVDDRARVYLFNRAAEKITGHHKAKVLGRGCRQIFPPHGLCGAECSFSVFAGCSTERHEHVVSFTTPDAKPKRLRMVLSPLAPPGCGSKGILVSIQDITETSLPVWGKGTFHGMVGRSKHMRQIYESIRHVALSDYPVLITGESGTGKELAARAMHLESKRTGGPFVPINCGALPENILESELFGHVRGAFTGAIRDKKGRFELADGGTLMLDEVGELSPAFQVKLLRVLQEMRFERVGGERSISVSVRIVSCSNNDLRAMVKEGTFREDLYYRLSVIPMALPPLRERSEDLPLIVDHILGQIRRETGRTIRRVSDDAMEKLSTYQWPGNIRELINALQFASIHCTGEVILPQHLPPEIRGWEGAPEFLMAEPATSDDSASDFEEVERGSNLGFDRPKSRKKLTRELVLEALDATGGNKVKAAKYLGVGRATLYRFLRDNPT